MKAADDSSEPAQKIAPQRRTETCRPRADGGKRWPLLLQRQPPQATACLHQRGETGHVDPRRGSAVRVATHDQPAAAGAGAGAGRGPDGSPPPPHQPHRRGRGVVRTGATAGRGLGNAGSGFPGQGERPAGRPAGDRCRHLDHPVPAAGAGASLPRKRFPRCSCSWPMSPARTAWPCCARTRRTSRSARCWTCPTTSPGRRCITTTRC